MKKHIIEELIEIFLAISKNYRCVGIDLNPNTLLIATEQLTKIIKEYPDLAYVENEEFVNLQKKCAMLSEGLEREKYFHKYWHRVACIAMSISVALIIGIGTVFILSSF